MRPARLYVGTSGFAYRSWMPRFYPPETDLDRLLPVYAARLNTVELNNTFYQQPRPERIAAWLAATPADFRFAIKAQRAGNMRAMGPAVAETVAWMTAPYRLFGDRLSAVLFRVPQNFSRDDDRLTALLDAWPPDLPLVTELQNPSWHVDEVFDMLREHRAVLCATDLDERPPPDLRLTGPFIYLRLRRTSYTEEELAEWADRLSPFLDAGSDCYVFFRHDADGASALNALEMLRLVDA